jgi:hypothetical protein
MTCSSFKGVCLALSTLIFLCAEPLWGQGSMYCFPQVVDGVSGDSFYLTNFFLNNVRSNNNTVAMQFFHSDGTPWLIDLHSIDRSEATGHVSSMNLILQAGETVNLFTGGTDPIAVGWVKIQSTLPLEASEVFSLAKKTSPSPALVWEAGVLPASSYTQFSLEANVSSDDVLVGTRVNIGVAIANPNGSTAVITATLFNRTGTQVSQKVLTIESNKQQAKFLNEIFDNFTFSGRFHGVVRFSCNVNIALVALRGSSGPGGDLFSTIAVNPDSTLGYNIFYDRGPNGSIDTSQLITLPTRIIGSMIDPTGTAEFDDYSVNLQAGQTLYVVAVADLLGSPLDSIIKILDSSGNPVASSNVLSPGLRDPFVRYVVPVTGTYCISYQSINNTHSSGSYYELLVTAK